MARSGAREDRYNVTVLPCGCETMRTARVVAGGISGSFELPYRYCEEHRRDPAS